MYGKRIVSLFVLISRTNFSRDFVRIYVQQSGCRLGRYVA